ncbi:MAG: carboxylating nicotinate-nucleotide diphosphorylase [Candidatus Thioglobus sp.]|uniref:carboxylating nicotinate-nucleotide diphosphorylase n=1 Tax=Candidatus Thioglobus sp. TaxID=2026721 RepID=UPI00260D6782|nr:carboxylating nicotinate-nucleotide diphosphorylase [Candidatus Thioglobus sp.]MDC9726538.1 carboxylating nicotinate-nucleotide diphosphorylase [Candidatus Thioglobus sp.]
MNKEIRAIVQLALAEDLGSGDVSADLLTDNTIQASIVCRENAVICGVEYAQSAFLLLNQDIQINWQIKEGDLVKPSQVLCTLSGSSRAIISGERVALNFLQTLSAVATQTQQLVAKISHTNAKLLDTRKTLPGLRLAQKYAVKCGGGVNHRLGLYDCVMLKENHIIASGSIGKAVARAQEKYPALPLIVEVETLDQLNEVLMLSGVTRALCDNFSVQMLAEAVSLAKGKLPLEASGNIDDTSIVEIAETGVDFISTGSITKNIQAVDLSLRFS